MNIECAVYNGSLMDLDLLEIKKEDYDKIEIIRMFDSVEEISDYAFDGCKSCIHIEIGRNVKRIGTRAFNNCYNANLGFIHKGVEEIEEYAFTNCDNLCELIIPPTVKFIGKPCEGCPNIFNILVKKGNKVYDSREYCKAIIENKSDTLIQGCNKTKIPSSVKIIGDGAFQGLVHLKRIVIPNGVEEIGMWAFENCSSLRNVFLGKSVKKIGLDAFIELEDLKIYYEGSMEELEKIENVDEIKREGIEIIYNTKVEYFNRYIR